MLAPQNIIYFKAEDKYVRIHTNTKTFTTVNTLKEIAEKLEDCYFQFIHKSYLINLDNIVEKSLSEVIMSNGDNLQIAKRKEVDFRKTFNNYLEKRWK